MPIGQLGAALDFGKALEGAALIAPAGILAAAAAALWWLGFVQATKENETAAIALLFLALGASWAAIALGIAWAT